MRVGVGAPDTDAHRHVLFTVGDNELIVLELESPGTALELREERDLG